MKRAMVVALALATGCSTASKDVATAHVPSTPYQALGCDQLALESARINVRTKQLATRLDQAANNDMAIMLVGAVLFWPALFALGGTREQEAEYARLKGENDAVELASRQKGCSTLAPGQQLTAAPQITPVVAVEPVLEESMASSGQ